MKRALFISGGWAGHIPEAFTARYVAELSKHGFECQCETETACLTRLDLSAFDLIVPNWTMGEWTKEESKALRDAVHGGVNLGGFHGGLGDAFRGDVEFKWMVGGMFVAHPYIGDYDITVTDPEHVIMQGIPTEFPYTSEQYYMLMDPGVHVLAETLYVYEGKSVPMPIAWVKQWGKGRVFYAALGHELAEFDRCPAALDLTVRGLRWAAGDLA
ncbi:ThuA domain-containing protein [Synoicihabitans lomoniglobus]|uniref:ThuA domain-containing protein n=1 Tax=Synoicihabitans lomoniglobus TaxID=2909285 RepID=A0AAE9ZQP4_9BACT|nr:ThuA domain-containing protein [Opitutaceae bacterium LMO-M01]WED63330.1 ThuA domain-containing protein [Opitutaceae bacterium LMO-M01]